MLSDIIVYVMTKSSLMSVY